MSRDEDLLAIMISVSNADGDFLPLVPTPNEVRNASVTVNAHHTNSGQLVSPPLEPHPFVAPFANRSRASMI
jgi:hypothetical protein